ncbi:diacylglycerol kinase [Aureimonas frigidaquae]|uniref:diacylglycerol kinase n=1 Tax=Aureimonas frigidaquae TaxID=424757 RepID=UPI00078626B6|nr:diacylglycerol kinase [Aureimonas frigidaquae]
MTIGTGLKTSGARHVLAAARYSMAGLRRLWHETAFRHEVLAASLLLGLLLLAGCGVAEVLLQAVLLMILFACEALNTAVEVIVDRVSPEISTFAGQAKDLGSFAVFSLIVANGLFAAASLIRLV